MSACLRSSRRFGHFGPQLELGPRSAPVGCVAAVWQGASYTKDGPSSAGLRSFVNYEPSRNLHSSQVSGA
uniref:Uncharacterized protein n=1 Tax=Parascaris univalens TaxID=6257 RepID=A0A914ZP28_PARUN